MDKNAINDIKTLLYEQGKESLVLYEEQYFRSVVLEVLNSYPWVTADDYIQLLTNHPEELEKLASSLNNNYSIFFRNPLSFSVIEQLIIPMLATKKKKEVRIWSAACAAGQEAYSLAMIFSESNLLFPDFNFRIFASDVEEKQIIKAKAAMYMPDVMECVSLGRINKWFTRVDDIYTVNHELKTKLDFFSFDLLNRQNHCPPNSIFGNFDFIACANMLFYYNIESRIQIIANLKKCLVADGIIMTGETEAGIMKENGFTEMFPKSCLYRF